METATTAALRHCLEQRRHDRGSRLRLGRDLMGHVGLGDMAFLSVCCQTSECSESRMFNAMVVPLVEHGIVPSTLAARMTHAGAPEALQAAVAAGLARSGQRVRRLDRRRRHACCWRAFAGRCRRRPPLRRPGAADRGGASRRQAHRSRSRSPCAQAGRSARGAAVRDRAGDRLSWSLRRADAAGREWKPKQATGRRLPVNATGAIGAMCCEMGMPPQGGCGARRHGARHRPGRSRSGRGAPADGDGNLAPRRARGIRRTCAASCATRVTACTCRSRCCACTPRTATHSNSVLASRAAVAARPRVPLVSRARPFHLPEAVDQVARAVAMLHARRRAGAVIGSA